MMEESNIPSKRHELSRLFPVLALPNNKNFEEINLDDEAPTVQPKPVEPKVEKKESVEKHKKKKEKKHKKSASRSHSHKKKKRKDYDYDRSRSRSQSHKRKKRGISHFSDSKLKKFS